MSDDTRETIPITSPLAVLTTRTTQEHLMTTHSTTDLKPGDIVQHPEKGNGLVRRSRVKRDEVVVMQVAVGDDAVSVYDITGWERVEIVRPGHVQVRVDDLDPQTLSEWSQYAGCNLVETALLRVGCASIARQAGQGDPTAQRAESTPPADEQDASATEAATYQCPWCSTDVTFSLRLDRHPGVGVMVWVAADGGHACPPAQPDEPTLFGARIVVTDDLSGKAERWCRQHDEYWASENGALMTWAYLTQRGTVTIGWDE